MDSQYILVYRLETLVVDRWTIWPRTAVNRSGNLYFLFSHPPPWTYLFLRLGLRISLSHVFIDQFCFMLVLLLWECLTWGLVLCILCYNSVQSTPNYLSSAGCAQFEIVNSLFRALVLWTVEIWPTKLHSQPHMSKETRVDNPPNFVCVGLLTRILKQGGFKKLELYIQFICFILMSQIWFSVQVLRAVHKLTTVFLIRGAFICSRECSL